MGIFEQVVAALLTTGVTALAGWVYNLSSRVVVLETERTNLDKLQELMTTKYDALERLLEIKFDNMHGRLGRIERAVDPPSGRSIRSYSFNDEE